jgi:glycerophosphoryl diester phosphodiesterase
MVPRLRCRTSFRISLAGIGFPVAKKAPCDYSLLKRLQLKVFAQFVQGFIAGAHRMHRRFFDPEPRIFAHRGDSAHYPENTLAAFTSAADIGADVIETDVRLTADGRFAVFHDETLERVTGRSGRVAERTLAAVQALDAGRTWTADGKTHPFRGRGLSVMSLEELLQAFPRQRFNIDLKDLLPGLAEKYCDVIRACGAAARVLTASFYTANLRAVRSIMPEMATSASRPEVIGAYLLYRAGLLRRKLRADAFQIPDRSGPLRVAGRGLVHALRATGARVHVWTINREQDMVRLLADGVDGIMSDDPALLKRVCGRPGSPG